MQTALQLLLTALQIGAVYILFSLGLTLVYGVMRVVNFVHGHFFAISALSISVAMPHLVSTGLSVHVAYFLAALGAIAVTLLLAFLVYRYGLRHFLRDMEGAFILTMGLALFLDGVLLSLFGGSVRAVPEIISGKIAILDVTVTLQRLVLCLAALLVTAMLYWVLAKTKMGKALRAVAADSEAAMLQGVPYHRMALSGFLIAALLASVAGTLIAPVTIVSPFLGADYLMKGFVAVIVGGLGSVPGAIAGALLIALVESVGGYYFDPSSATIAIFVLVIAVLLIKPKGIFANG